MFSSAETELYCCFCKAGHACQFCPCQLRLHRTQDFSVKTTQSTLLPLDFLGPFCPSSKQPPCKTRTDTKFESFLAKTKRGTFELSFDIGNKGRNGIIHKRWRRTMAQRRRKCIFTTPQRRLLWPRLMALCVVVGHIFACIFLVNEIPSCWLLLLFKSIEPAVAGLARRFIRLCPPSLKNKRGKSLFH